MITKAIDNLLEYSHIPLQGEVVEIARGRDSQGFCKKFKKLIHRQWQILKK